MKKRLPFVLALVLCGACPLLAQEEKHPPQQAEPPHNATPKAPRANGGRVPPPPTKRENRPANTPEHGAQGQQENRPENKKEARQDNRPEARQQNIRPHVEDNQWFGHDTNDERYRHGHPFQHGHFERFGQQYRYSVQRIDRDHHRFWFPGGFYFQIADWDWAIASDWCWNCGDDFVIYEDPDHDGWYLVYDVDTGEYVHAEYLGS
jgi:hypothetical protein